MGKKQNKTMSPFLMAPPIKAEVKMVSAKLDFYLFYVNLSLQSHWERILSYL